MSDKIEEERNRILQVLDLEDASVSISGIATLTGLNRHTVARHMDSLEILGKVRKLDIGRAKKYLLVKKLPEYSLIDISSDLIIVLSPQLTVQYLNRAAAHHFKTSLNRCIGKKIQSLWYSLFNQRDFIEIFNNFTYENSEQITLQDERGFWYEMTIIGLSLLHAPNQIAVICTDVTEKKRSGEALRIAQEKYGFAFHASPDGIVMRDIQTGEILEANQSYCNLTGYSLDEMLGKTAIDLGLIRSDHYCDALLRNIIQSESSQYRYDLQIRRNSGEFIDVSCSATVIRMADRDCLLISVRDISEQKRIEENIRKSEELYRLLADNTQDVIWTLDPSGYSFTYISPSVERLLGYCPEEVMKVHISKIITQSSYLRMMLKLSYFINYHNDKGSPSYCRLRIHYINSDGKIIPTEAGITFIRNSNGEITGILGVSRDISVHLDITKKLKKSEQHYRLLAESVKDVVWIMDPISRKYRYISPSVIRLLGWTPAELSQKYIDEIISPDSVSNFISACTTRCQEFLETNVTRYYTDELKIIKKDGHAIWTEIVSHISRNEETGAVEMVGVSRDIAEKKSAYQKLVENETHFKLIFDNMRDVIWILDLKRLNFTYVSPTIINLRGYHPDEIIGRSLEELYSKHVFDVDGAGSRLLNEQIRAYESGNDTARYRRSYLTSRHRDGSVVDTEVSTSLISGSDRQVTLIIGVTRQISCNDGIKHPQFIDSSCFTVE